MYNSYLMVKHYFEGILPFLVFSIYISPSMSYILPLPYFWIVKFLLIISFHTIC